MDALSAKSFDKTVALGRFARFARSVGYIESFLKTVTSARMADESGFRVQN
jgi:hypothetical protein